MDRQKNKIGGKRGKGGEREREFKLMPICYFIESRM